jgi:hypothetical protein
MNPLHTYYNDNVKKIKYKNYEIDDTHHLQSLNNLTYLLDKSNKYNLDLKITGAWAFVFKTDKIYRTINDMDFIILKKDFHTWLKILSDEFLFCYPSNEKVDNFVSSSFKKQCTIFRLKHVQEQIPFNFIDFILTKEFTQKLYSIKTIENYTINYRFPYKFLYPKNSYFNYKRVKDIDDNSFYSECL